MSSSVLDAVRNFAPEIEARSEEIETARAVPPDICNKLRDIGCLTMGIPERLGGSELDALTISRILETLGHADASVAWTAMVALGFNLVYARFADHVVDQVRSTSPDFLTRGALAPQGRAVPCDGGYQVSGRWALASGSYAQRHMLANCLVVDADGKPLPDERGAPQMRVALLPADAVEMLDTWHSVGLRGTASHDFIIAPRFVPEDWTAAMTDPDRFGTPITGLPFPVASTPNHASVCVGIAQGALDDLTLLARSKRPAMSGGKTLASDPLFTYRLGELAVRLDGLRAFLETKLADTTAQVRHGSTITSLGAAQTGAMASYVQHECQDIVDRAFELAGSTACYTTSRLQRRWRDIRCVVQHFAASRTKYQGLGATLCAA